MYYNTNLSVKETSRAVLSDFKGVDYSNPISRIQSNRASYMRNFINENGVNRKRNGWVNILSDKDDIKGEIQGIYQFVLDGKTFILVAKGDYYYFIEKKSGNRYEYAKKFEKLNGVKKNSFFVNNNKLFIINGFKYYVLFSDDGGTTYQMVEVSSIGYIPTTTVNINKDGTDNDIRASLESVNLLSNRRKNQLVGDVAGSTFSLDAENLVQIDLPLSRRVKVTGEIKNDDGSIKTVNFISASGNNNIVDDDDDKVVGSIDYNKGTITFTIDTTPPTPNKDNLIVEFETQPQNGEYKINKCHIGSLFGVNGTPDRLFLSGNPDYPNIEWHSAENDFTYFPDINVTVVGSENNPIYGYASLSDSTQIIYKRENKQEATIYFRTGEYRTVYESDGQTIKDIQAVFSIRAGAIGEGAVSERGNGCVANDTLMLSSNGVYGIEFSDNVVSQQRFAKERSRFINSELVKNDLSKAESITYKNRFYIAVGDKIFVADSRYKSAVEGDMADTFNYEWWIWDNCPVYVWSIVDNELWFGTKDGRICRFEENNFADTKINSFVEDEISVNSDGDAFVVDINKISQVQVGDIVNFLVAGVGYAFTEILLQPEDILGVVEAEIYKNGIKQVHKAFRVKESVANRFKTSYFDANYTAETDYFDADFDVFALDNSISGVIKKAEKYYLVYERGQSVVFLLKNYATTYIEVTEQDISSFAMSLKDNYEVVDVNYDTGEFKISHYENNEICYLVDLNKITSYTKPKQAVTVINKIPVVAEWQTPAFNFGVIDTNKTMTGISIATEKYIGGRLKVGWQTKNTSNELNVKGISYFDFNNVDFKEFTFDNSFISSDTKRVKVNFNYIVFRFVSDNDKCCAINEFAVLYKANNKNKGVR